MEGADDLWGTPAVPNSSLEAEVIGLSVGIQEFTDDAESTVIPAHGAGL